MRGLYLIIAAMSLIFPCIAFADDETHVKHSTGKLKDITGEETWAGLWDRYLSKKDERNRYEQSDRLIRITAVSENAFVFFTKDMHPAHPSFAKIYLVKGEGNRLTLRTFGFTWGDRGSYDKFMQEEILEYSKNLARQISQDAGR